MEPPPGGWKETDFMGGCHGRRGEPPAAGLRGGKTIPVEVRPGEIGTAEAAAVDG